MGRGPGGAAEPYGRRGCFMSRRYAMSETMLARALQSIPLGSQTFSKSKTQFPTGVSPFFAKRAAGCRLWDVDDNEYIDFISALGAVLLGYGDAEVDEAVRRQIQDGVTFSLSHPLEVEVAERLIDMIPCAEQVRFAKNGTDATSAAIRLARACTGRDRIATCGYHGWADWSIATTTRDLGVPQAVSALSHSFPYADPAALEALLAEHRDEFAAVILEPVSVREPQAGYLQEVQAIAKAHGALLVFDETLTGFRLHRGGAQALYGVTPDLATFGKGLANGYPLSALVGSKATMVHIEDIFFSGTFGGETVSLAAARVVLDRVVDEDIPAKLATAGQLLADGMQTLLADSEAGTVFASTGYPSRSVLSVNATEQTPAAVTQTLLLQELFARGILNLGAHNLSAAHGRNEIEEALAVYAEVLPQIAELAIAGDAAEQLKADVLQPLFSVR